MRKTSAAYLGNKQSLISSEQIFTVKGKTVQDNLHMARLIIKQVHSEAVPII